MGRAIVAPRPKLERRSERVRAPSERCAAFRVVSSNLRTSVSRSGADSDPGPISERCVKLLLTVTRATLSTNSSPSEPMHGSDTCDDITTTSSCRIELMLVWGQTIRPRGYKLR